ncbi:MAG: glycine cleavage system protein GcvH [SAR324 cluster bacterium]|nr:glycine cleavage system protein GcvH [SAR324 cluster bacterium]
MREIASGLLYSKDHEWVRIDGTECVIGISDHAQNSLGDIVFVELPALDDEIDAGDEFGTIESVKAVSSLVMPMSGKVIEINEALDDEPEMVNDDCYGAGWIIRIETANMEEQAALLSPEQYEAFLAEEEPE